MKNKKSSGTDQINNVLVKMLKEAIVKPLSIIFNKSLFEGVFPDRMKMADVIPLYKGKNRLNKENYQPILLLLTLSKILEKILHSCMYNFLEKTNQLYQDQYGFPYKHSCENAIQNLISDVVKGDTNGKITTAIFLALSKAFDTLNYTILLKKLEKYGMCGTSLQWYQSYLGQRKMRVKCKTGINSTTVSEISEVEYGAPQGSCLGPLLFTIFTNDLSKHLTYTKCILFADDTTIYMCHKNPTYLKLCIEDDLQMLSDWFRANVLTLNIDKSVCMTDTSLSTNVLKYSIDIPKLRHDRSITMQ